MSTIESGKARLLMVTNRQRSPIAPEVPTAAEAGFPELTFEGVVGFFGRRDMPIVLRDRIASDVAAVAESPRIVSRLRPLGVVVRSGPRRNFQLPLKNSAQRSARSLRLKERPADGLLRAGRKKRMDIQCWYQKPLHRIHGSTC